MKYLSKCTLMLIGLLMLSWCYAIGQLKYEREYALKRAAVPPQAAAFISEIFKDARVQWYREENLKGTSIEAKLKYSGKQLSIEFSDSGLTQDVEILTKFNALPAEASLAITKYLKQDFKSLKISKTQIQWTGSRQALKQALLGSIENENKVPAGITIKYELIVKGKKGNISGYYEVLADNTGSVENTRQIIQRNTDNLIY